MPAIGIATADTVNSISAVDTSRLASACGPPESGTRTGMPMRRMPEYTSTITHSTSWNHVSQTSSTRMATAVLVLTCLVRRSPLRSSSGSGGPARRRRA